MTLPRLVPLRHGLAGAVLLLAFGGTPACTLDQPPQERALSCNRLLARSVSFGNMLEQPDGDPAGPALRDEFVRLTAAAGFTAIRLPVRWDARASLEAPYRIDPAFFARVDAVLALAWAEHLAVVLDMHHYAAMMLTPLAERERFLVLWRQVAEHYRDAPPQLMFELLNEPNRELTRTRWNDALAAVLPVIRASNPQRTLIVGGGDWNSGLALESLVLPADDRNLIATFHYYEPMPVTHQGAEWVDGAAAWIGTRWSGTPAQRQRLDDDFDRVMRWAQRERRPVLLGEFGVYARAPEPTRIAWTRVVRDAARTRGFSWAYWELAAGFGVLEPRTLAWRQPLLDALLAP